jgi:hypothetical protein
MKRIPSSARRIVPTGDGSVWLVLLLALLVQRFQLVGLHESAVYLGNIDWGGWGG